MAKPIKETPILQGRDAVNFFQNMKEAEQRKVSIEKIAQIKENANRLRSIFK